MILVTGANGFMASNLIKEARRRGQQVCGVSTRAKELANYLHIVDSYDRISNIINEINPEIVYHFAANPLVSATEGVIESNVVLTDNVCRASKGRHLVFASSVSVYGCKQKVFTLDDPVDPESLYAVTKVQCEELLKFYSKSHLSSTCIRYVTNVGKEATHGVLPDVIRKIKENSFEITLYGEGNGSMKPYLHVTDAMKATLDIKPAKGFTLLNMSPDDAISVSRIVDVVSETLGCGRVIKNWDKSKVWPGDQTNFRIQCDFKFPKSEYAIKRATNEITNNRL
jgi:nucleoside-diphosphate-sugar epimerase